MRTDWQRVFENDGRISPEDELEAIFLKNPVFVVTQYAPYHFSDFQTAFLHQKLKSDYTLVATVPDLYARRKNNDKDVLIYEKKGVY